MINPGNISRENEFYARKLVIEVKDVGFTTVVIRESALHCNLEAS